MDLREYLQQETVAHLGYRAPVTVRTDTSLEETIRLMQAERVGCVLVMDKDRLAGIFTERDVLKRVLYEKRPLREPVGMAMSREPLVARCWEPLHAVLGRMHAGGHRRIPVLDEAGRPLGTLSIKRAVRCISDQFPAAVYNLPPEPHQYGKTREGA